VNVIQPDHHSPCTVCLLPPNHIGTHGPKASFPHVFDRLRHILDQAHNVGVVTTDDTFLTNTPIPLYKKSLFLGAVQVSRIMSALPMPVYMYPELLTGSRLP
jgi:hypothetical protein